MFDLGAKTIFCNFLLFAQKMAKKFLHYAKNEKRKKCAALLVKLLPKKI